MPTRAEMEYQHNVKRLATAAERIATAMERDGEDPDRTLYMLDLTILKTALDQHRLHVEEERDATGDDEMRRGLTQRLEMIDVTGDKLDRLGAR